MIVSVVMGKKTSVTRQAGDLSSIRKTRKTRKRSAEKKNVAEEVFKNSRMAHYASSKGGIGEHMFYYSIFFVPPLWLFRSSICLSFIMFCNLSTPHKMSRKTVLF